MGIIRPVCVFLICEYLREMNFFLSRRSTLILFSLIYADFIRNHLYEYYAALQLRIVLLHFSVTNIIAATQLNPSIAF
jgi:hypothetical protein